MSDQEHGYINCVAYGCRMHGSMARSTNGSKDWLCSVHFAADKDDWQAISAELNRLEWLVWAAQTVRANQFNPRAREWMPEVNKQIRLAQRGDLCFNGTESIGTWSSRLEKVLSDSCRAVVESAPVQTTIQES